MDPSFLVTTVQAAGGGGVMGDVFLAHFRPISDNWASFKCHSHVHPFMSTMYQSSDGYFQPDAQCHKAGIISNWFLEHDNEFTVLKKPPQSPDLNPIEHGGSGCGGTGAL